MPWEEGKKADALSREQMTTESPHFRNSFARARPTPA